MAIISCGERKTSDIIFTKTDVIYCETQEFSNKSALTSNIILLRVSYSLLIQRL